MGADGSWNGIEGSYGYFRAKGVSVMQFQALIGRIIPSILLIVSASKSLGLIQSSQH